MIPHPLPVRIVIPVAMWSWLMGEMESTSALVYLTRLSR